MNDFIVVFGKDNARIQHGIDPNDWKDVPNVAVNPDLSAVKGIPPHHWQIVDSKIVPKPESERQGLPPVSRVEHTVTVSPEAFKPHLDSHLTKANAELTKLAIQISVGVSLLVSIFANLIGHWFR